MKTEKVIWGLLLVFVGGIILLDNLGVIDFYWTSIWRFWPLLLILSGINMLFTRSDSRAGGLVSIVVTCLVLSFIAYKGITSSGTSSSAWFDGGSSRTGSSGKRTTLSEPFVNGTQRAVLNISGGASSFDLSDSTSSLFEATASEAAGRYTLKKTSRDSLEIIDFKMEEKNGDWKMRDNEVKFKINTAPVWNVTIKMGAGELDFDLSRFKVEKLTVEGGAASFELKLGMPQTTTDVNIKTGVSDIELSVPKEAGCLIKVDSGLSSEDFPGFTRQEDGSYISPNYRSAAKKIIIGMKGGLSNFEVNRY